MTKGWKNKNEEYYIKGGFSTSQFEPFFLATYTCIIKCILNALPGITSIQNIDQWLEWFPLWAKLKSADYYYRRKKQNKINIYFWFQLQVCNIKMIKFN